MSLAMFLRAVDGVLVVTDGREVLDAGNGLCRWQSDRARKITSYAGPAPVIGAAVGLAAVGAGESEQDVLSLIDEVLQSDRPALGLASGDGPWTAKATANEARHRAEQRMEGLALGDSVVLGAVVDWQAEAADPVLVAFELRAIEVLELADEDDPSSGHVQVRCSSSSEREVDDFKTTKFAAFPERSPVWEALRPEMDSTVELVTDVDAELDDPRWYSPFKWADLELEALAQRVSLALDRLQRSSLEAFHEGEVGGVWVFGLLRPGMAPTFVEQPLGPHHVDGTW